MRIELHSVCPVPMNDLVAQEGHIWKNEIEVDSSRYTGVLAASGRGKTSLISFLYGIRRDYTGKISMDGNDISSFSLQDWTKIRKEKIACVFQDLRLISHLSMLENLLLKNNLTHYYSEKELRAMAEQLGMENKMNQQCGTLSLGQQQRVAIIRGLLQPFSWILFDEPFSHLDKENITKANSLIFSECKKRNAGALMVSLGESFGWNFDDLYKL